jgi:hypothetical protein
MKTRALRPELRLEMGSLGTVDPFGLTLREDPGSPGVFVVERPASGTGPPARLGLDLAGLNLIGAAHALFSLSSRWLEQAGRLGNDPESTFAVPSGEVRLRVRRREARLVASLLRRHLARLPQPPGWMREFLVSLEEIDHFLRWDELGGGGP